MYNVKNNNIPRTIKSSFTTVINKYNTRSSERCFDKPCYKTNKKLIALIFSRICLIYAPKNFKRRLISIFLQLLFYFIEFLALLHILFLMIIVY